MQSMSVMKEIRHLLVSLQLKRELDICEEEKKANMKSFILEIRSELKELWEKCFVNVGDQEAFFEMESTDFSEELLEAHEAEVTKWKEYYEKNLKMIESVSFPSPACSYTHEGWILERANVCLLFFIQIQRRALCWAKWLELEAIEDDPGRLANRGGALLKHEKEKKSTKKMLDRAEADIKKLDAEYVKVHGTHFTIRGIPVLECIDEEKAIAADERLERKNQRVSGAMKISVAWSFLFHRGFFSECLFYLAFW